MVTRQVQHAKRQGIRVYS